MELTDIGIPQVQSRQVDQGTQAGKVCTEKGASVSAGVRYSDICIDRLGGQRFKLAISRPRDATNNKQQQPFFSYLPSTSSGSFISVAVAGSGTFAASHSERGAIEREAFESFLEPVAGGCLASC